MASGRGLGDDAVRSPLPRAVIRVEAMVAERVGDEQGLRKAGRTESTKAPVITDTGQEEGGGLIMVLGICKNAEAELLKATYPNFRSANPTFSSGVRNFFRVPIFTEKYDKKKEESSRKEKKKAAEEKS